MFWVFVAATFVVVLLGVLLACLIVGDEGDGDDGR